MSYDLYFGDILLPVTPSTIDIQYPTRNETMTLINDGEINVTHEPGLKTVSFTLLLPNQEYPFSKYLNGFKKASWFMDRIQKLKKKQTPFQLIISRAYPKGNNRKLDATNLKVVIEDYTAKEDRKNAGFDLQLDIRLKEYKPFGTKTFSVKTPGPTAPITIKKPRDEPSKPPSGGGTGLKKFTVQIPGMSPVTVNAKDAQDAIYKSSAKNWTGTIYVNGTQYYVIKGKISDPPAETPPIDPPAGGTPPAGKTPPKKPVVVRE